MTELEAGVHFLGWGLVLAATILLAWINFSVSRWYICPCQCAISMGPHIGRYYGDSSRSPIQVAIPQVTQAT